MDAINICFHWASTPMPGTTQDSTTYSEWNQQTTKEFILWIYINEAWLTFKAYFSSASPQVHFLKQKKHNENKTMPSIIKYPFKNTTYVFLLYKNLKLGTQETISNLYSSLLTCLFFLTNHFNSIRTSN